ncbi:MAG: Gluconolactonase [Labilithrix sp.]|nr:Gluconolactonase [Labilithrix sp.]
MSLHRRRLGLVLAALPFVFYAYACADDETSPPGVEEDAGGQQDGGGGNSDSSTPDTDSSTPRPDAGDAGDASDGGEDDAGPLACSGNPLLADGGADAGIVINPDGGALKAIADGPFLDGPQWIDDDAGGAGIVYSEVSNQVIVRNGPDGGARVVLRATGEGNLPIGNGRVGNLIYTALARESGGGGGVLRMLLDGGQPTGFDGGPANSPNDLVGSSKGFVYFTDPNFQASGPSTGIYRLAPDGGVTTVTTFAGGQTNRADGIALTKDESTLYVGLFDQGKIRKYTVDANGVASNGTELPFTPAESPTGIAVDVAGNLWIAENAGGDDPRGRIEVFTPAGKKWGEIPFPDSRPTGIAFGGADSKTVYVTTERGIGNKNGTLYVLKSQCAGVQ